jgi:hypothetical protein
MAGRHMNDGMDRSDRTQPLDNLRPLTASLYMQQQLWERTDAEVEVKLSNTKPNK